METRVMVKGMTWKVTGYTVPSAMPNFLAKRKVVLRLAA